MIGAGEAAMSAAAVEAFLEAEFPQLHAGGRLHSVVSVGRGEAVMRCAYHPSQLRPGGTLSGPTVMTLCDVGLYVAILASIGPVGLAVTTNLSVNFLRKPRPADLVARVRLLKLGKRLAVGEALVVQDDDDAPVAQATGTYSIPPRA